MSEIAFYEKVIKVKADVAALLTFLVLCGFRHIPGENFALGSLRSDDWQLGRPTAPPLLSVFRVFSPPNASSSVLYRPGGEGRGCQGRPEGAFILTLTAPPLTSSSSWERSATQFSWASFLSGFGFQFVWARLPQCFRTVCLDHSRSFPEVH